MFIYVNKIISKCASETKSIICICIDAAKFFKIIILEGGQFVDGKLFNFSLLIGAIRNCNKYMIYNFMILVKLLEKLLNKNIKMFKDNNF